MNSRRVAVLVLVVCVALDRGPRGSARPSPDDNNSFAAADAQILSEIRDHSEAMANLEYLSDNIGQRLTGSPQLKQANDWTRDKFAQYGLTNAHLEPWTMARSWTRGTARARIVAPAEHPLTIAAAGWSPGTPGVVRGQSYISTQEERGVRQVPRQTERRDCHLPRARQPFAAEAGTAVRGSPACAMQKPPARMGEPPTPILRRIYAGGQRANGILQARRRGRGAARLEQTARPAEHDRRQPGKVRHRPIPTAFVTGEGYRMIYRMLKHGPVQVEIEMTNTFGDKPMEVYNTVADIRGSEKPDEMVILGAHLDSWDLGTGSTDNGTGSMAVLEAARALAKLNLKPKRTIRFVLFTGEEQGLYGSEEYVKAHQKRAGKNLRRFGA